jgi:hypothetical protein
VTETDPSRERRLRLSKNLTQHRQDHEERSTKLSQIIRYIRDPDRIELTLAVCLTVAGMIAGDLLIGRVSVLSNDLKEVPKTLGRSQKRMQKGRERSKTRV